METALLPATAVMVNFAPCVVVYPVRHESPRKVCETGKKSDPLIIRFTSSNSSDVGLPSTFLMLIRLYMYEVPDAS